MPSGPPDWVHSIEAIRRQQSRVAEEHGQNAPWLFPALVANPNGKKAMPAANLRKALNHALVTRCEVRDRAGQRITRLAWGQFRDTRATELLNEGVSPITVAKWLDHKDLSSLKHYCTVHIETMRRAMRDAPLIGMNGQEVLGDVKDLPREARSVEEMRRMVKQATNAVQGVYCTLPVQEECPHLNRCYSCQKFATTPDKLPGLLAHLQDSYGLK